MISRHLHVLLLLVPFAASCSTASPPAAPSGIDAFWTELRSLCGQAFEGSVVEGTEPSDEAFAAERLVMHVSRCDPDEIRIPFHVGDNRSRTWVITRTDSGLRLKHDHRHQDGSEDEITWYGGDSARVAGLAAEFPADAWTAELIPAAAANVWTIAIVPGRTFTYALRRGDRRFRAEFDLTRPVEAPPDPW